MPQCVRMAFYNTVVAISTSMQTPTRLNRYEPSAECSGALGDPLNLFAQLAGLVGFVLERLIQQVGSQLQEGQRQADDISQRAAAVIESDPRVRRALGGATVRVSQSPTSQSSSTVYVNGRRSAEVTLLLPVSSSSGTTAMAQVLSLQSPS